MERKCGTCADFAVRPTEIELSRAAKPMSVCGPGSYCHGGPVRGWCQKHGRMEESTNVKPCHRPGGPVMKQAGAQNKRPMRALADGDLSFPDLVRDTVSNRGPLMAFAAVGVLAFAGAVTKHRKWREGEIQGLPYVEDGDGLPYYYSVAPGARKVELFLPVGRKVRHHVSEAALTDDRQLEAEVLNLVLDNYQSLG